MSNLWNAGAKGGDGHYCQRGRHPDLRDDQENAGRRSRQRHLDGPGGGAETSATSTPLPSLELGVDSGRGRRGCWPSDTRAFTVRTLPGAIPTRRWPREINPRSVYERFIAPHPFRSGDAAKMDTLLLDRVLGDAKRLRARGGRRRSRAAR